MDKTRIKPFYCGGQFSDWTGANCDRCTKGSHTQPPDEWPHCPLEAALTEASIDDGYVDQDIATRIGYVPLAAYKREARKPTVFNSGMNGIKLDNLVYRSII